MALTLCHHLLRCISLFRWTCTKSKYDLCQKCNTKLARKQLDAKQADTKQEATVVVAGAGLPATVLAKAQDGETQTQSDGAGEAKLAEPPAAA